jgi:peptidoglycan hydrolase CwlO-like protein
MIIVKTKNGDHFVNENVLMEVAHDKEKASVYCYRNDGYITTIVNVESVVYTNVDQTAKYEDKGSRVAELEASLHDQSVWGNNIRTKYYELEKENDELKDELDKLKREIEKLRNQMPVPLGG